MKSDHDWCQFAGKLIEKTDPLPKFELALIVPGGFLRFFNRYLCVLFNLIYPYQPR